MTSATLQLLEHLKAELEEELAAVKIAIEQEEEAIAIEREELKRTNEPSLAQAWSRRAA